MKTLITSLLALTSYLAAAQHSSISRSINDDEKTLSIKVQGTIDGKPVDYDRSYDVSHLSLTERNALRERVLDSLNINMPEPPEPPTLPKAPGAPAAPKAPKAPRLDRDHESVTMITGDKPKIWVSEGNKQAVAVGGKNPYTKEVNYDSESGKLYLRYKFQKDGEEITYERTLNARDKSQQERQRIIDEIEKEIGIPAASN
ncbi:lipoprotein 17-related variable surface protein [Spirosoma koreense]